jgi:hypothetical protein
MTLVLVDGVRGYAGRLAAAARPGPVPYLGHSFKQREASS